MPWVLAARLNMPGDAVPLSATLDSLEVASTHSAQLQRPDHEEKS